MDTDGILGPEAVQDHVKHAWTYLGAIMLRCIINNATAIINVYLHNTDVMNYNGLKYEVIRQLCAMTDSIGVSCSYMSVHFKHQMNNALGMLDVAVIQVHRPSVCNRCVLET